MPKRKVSAAPPASLHCRFFSFSFFCSSFGRKKAASCLFGDVEAGEVMPKFPGCSRLFTFARFWTRLAVLFLPDPDPVRPNGRSSGRSSGPSPPLPSAAPR